MTGVTPGEHGEDEDVSGVARHTRSYFICATPRTGSSLLCGLLAAAGTAGRPESYFRKPDRRSWATSWGVVGSDGSIDDVDFLVAALNAGTGENGVFAARIMWGTMHELVDVLRSAHDDTASPAMALLTRTFKSVQFVHLRRGDIVAQAVSRVRAEQSNVWFHEEGRPLPAPERQPRFDFGEIDAAVRAIHNDEDAWHAWFSRAGVRPHRVQYEELEADPVGTTLGVLRYLALEPVPGALIAPRHRRLRDALNAQWADRYLAELPDSERPRHHRR